MYIVIEHSKYGGVCVFVHTLIVHAQQPILYRLYIITIFLNEVKKSGIFVLSWV